MVTIILSLLALLFLVILLTGLSVHVTRITDNEYHVRWGFSSYTASIDEQGHKRTVLIEDFYCETELHSGRESDKIWNLIRTAGGKKQMRDWRFKY